MAIGAIFFVVAFMAVHLMFVDAAECKYDGCQCDEGIPQGQYCDGSYLYECNPDGGCCNCGYRTSCDECGELYC